MRSNQVSIFIERFGEYVPEDYPADVQRIHVYCDDSKSIYAALSKAYAMAVNELAEYERIGVRADVTTNEFSRGDYRDMHAILPKTKQTYEEDVNFQYYDTDLELCDDFVWVYEHSGEIMEVIKACGSAEGMKAELKERFGLSDYQVRKLSQMRLEMFSEGEYRKAREKAKEIREERAYPHPLNTEYYKYYLEDKRRKLEQKIKRQEAFLNAADHWEEIMKMLMETEDPSEFEEMMGERYGFSREEARAFKYTSMDDFSGKGRQKREKELSRLKKELASTEEWLAEEGEEGEGTGGRADE